MGKVGFDVLVLVVDVVVCSVVCVDELKGVLGKVIVVVVVDSFDVGEVEEEGVLVNGYFGEFKGDVGV